MPTVFSKMTEPLNMFRYDHHLLQDMECMDEHEILHIWKGSEYSTPMKAKWTKDQLIDLRAFYVDQREVRKITGCDFHSWVVDKQTGKTIDDYLDRRTRCGRAVHLLKDILKCPTLTYVEWEDGADHKPSLRRLFDDEMYGLNNHAMYRRWFEVEEFWGVGECLARAIKIYHTNPERYEIKFGEVWLENRKTGKRVCLEGACGDNDETHLHRESREIKRDVAVKINHKFWTTKRINKILAYDTMLTCFRCGYERQVKNMLENEGSVTFGQD